MLEVTKVGLGPNQHSVRFYAATTEASQQLCALTDWKRGSNGTHKHWTQKQEMTSFLI